MFKNKKFNIKNAAKNKTCNKIYTYMVKINRHEI